MVDFMESILTHPPRKTDLVLGLIRPRLIGGKEDHSLAAQDPTTFWGPQEEKNSPKFIGTNDI